MAQILAQLVGLPVKGRHPHRFQQRAVPVEQELIAQGVRRDLHPLPLLPRVQESVFQVKLKPVDAHAVRAGIGQAQALGLKALQRGPGLPRLLDRRGLGERRRPAGHQPARQRYGGTQHGQGRPSRPLGTAVHYGSEPPFQRPLLPGKRGD